MLNAAKKIHSNLLKQIAINWNVFQDYLNGSHGEKKQLFAHVINNYDSDFLKNIVDGAIMQKLDGVVYLKIEDISSFFDLRKYNIERWESKEKKKLLHPLLHTPICYVYHIQSTLSAIKNLSNLFGKATTFKPVKKICTKCNLFLTCKGTKAFRNESK